MDALYFSLACIFLVYSGVPGAGADTALGCDQGWVVDTNKNYCYLFNNQMRVQYASAQTECNTFDSSLLRVLSPTELTWYTSTVKKFPSAGYWTDLNDIPKSPAASRGTGKWKWGHFDYADISFLPWAKAPTNDGVSNCGGMNSQGKMEDLDCKSQQWWICQYVATAGCKEAWITRGNRCYWVASSTSANQQRLSWTDADAKCKGMAAGAYLVTLNNADDKAFVASEVRFLLSTSVFWTGLKYNNNNWQWYNGEAFSANFFTWQTERDNVAGNENCGVLRTNGKFSDRDCTTFNNFVCKKPMPYYDPSDNIGCGSWVRAGQFCYNFYYTIPLAWTDARATCQTHNGDLVKVDSLDKRFWLTQQLLEPANAHTFWTGLNDRSLEGTYVWADGTALNTAYINWNQEPNDYMGNEDCGLIYNTGQYNDAACSQHAAAICEFDKQGLTLRLGQPTHPRVGMIHVHKYHYLLYRNIIKVYDDVVLTTTTRTETSRIHPIQTTCKAGWKSRPSEISSTVVDCYLFTPYYNSTVVYTQMEASAYCAGLSVSATVFGQLLSVNSAAEQKFIKQTVMSMLDNDYGWWTSLNDIQNEGYWMFAQGFEGGNFVEWQGEPSTVSASWDCAFMNNNGEYHMRDCKGTQGYICERWATIASNSLTNAISGAAPIRGLRDTAAVIAMCIISYVVAY